MKKILLLIALSILTTTACSNKPVDKSALYRELYNTNMPGIENMDNIPPSYLHNSTINYHSIKCEYDHFQKLTACRAPALGNFDDDHYGSMYNGLKVSPIFSFDRKNKIKNISLTISTTSKKQPEFSSARDSSGKKLKFKKIDGGPVNGNFYFEAMSIELNSRYLKTHKYSGIDIRLYGDNTTRDINLPAPYVRGLIRYINEHTNLR